MTRVNGEVTDQLSVDDRGFQFGDGLFETIAVYAGSASLLGRHMRRLQYGCKRLAIDTINFDQLTETIRQQAAPLDRAVLKLIITAGNSLRGYRRSSASRPSIIIKISAMSAIDKTENIKAMLCETRLARQPRLAGIKHLNRLEQVLARNEWDDESIHEGLLLDTDGWLIEATMSNCFLVKDKQITTPDLTNCGVAGVMRSVVMDIAQAAELSLKTTRITLDELAAADEVFLTSSVFGIRPVCEIIGVGRYEVGPLTQQIQKEIMMQVAQDFSNNWYAC